jgi:hypothetical protein
MPEKAYRVFISSTFQDLASHREAVARTVLQFGGIPFALESFAATGEPVAEVVKDALTQSDVAVFIVGHRYGAIIPNTGKSWVEAEYDTARSRRIPTFVFMPHDDAPWPIANVDADRSQIERFRGKVLAASTVTFLTSPEDLAAAVARSLSHYLIRREASQLAPEDVSIRQIRVIRLLLSSPGDVATERDHFARAVFRFNQDAVEERNLFIKLIRWEALAPQVGPGPQSVINKQIGKYHIFTGIMWNRFGTPTDIASSGTEEEFDAAVSSWRTHRKPWVCFNFCERAANFTTEEQLLQKQKVLRFRASVQELGVVRTFLDSVDFENLAYRDLLRITALPEFQKDVGKMRTTRTLPNKIGRCDMKLYSVLPGGMEVLTRPCVCPQVLHGSMRLSGGDREVTTGRGLKPSR